MQLKIENPNIPAGQYQAVFEEVRPTNHDKYGPGLLWCFRITHGPEAGRKGQRTTKPDPTPRNSCGKFLAGLAGQMPQEGQVIDTDAYIGSPYMITVVNTATPGITRIEHIHPTTAADQQSLCAPPANQETTPTHPPQRQQPHIPPTNPGAYGDGYY